MEAEIQAHDLRPHDIILAEGDADVDEFVIDCGYVLKADGTTLMTWARVESEGVPHQTRYYNNDHIMYVKR